MIPLNEALQQIRNLCPSNPGILDDLKDRLTSPHPIPLLPFVGAGLSRPMGFPLWGDFLRALAGECGKTAEIEALLRAQHYEEAAEVVEQGLSEAIFNGRIRHTFGEEKSNRCELTGAVLVLPDVAGGAVVTTNFDGVLERVFESAGKPFERVVWGAQVDSIRRAVTGNQPFLLKLHGDAEEQTDRVLTKSEYDKHYAPGGPKSLREVIGRVFLQRTLLFIGCSLANDRTMEVLAEASGQAAGQRHFAIVEKPALEKEFFAKQKHLGDRGILPVWYPNQRHDLIEPLLRWIAGFLPSSVAPAPDLVLERPKQRKIEVRNELDLLVPYQRTTTFCGRDQEMAGLQAWVRPEAPVSVRVVTGSGGSGKTRLAVELLEWLEAGEPKVWNLGFLTQAEMERFSALQNLSHWRRRKPVLAVLDYAAGSAEKLRVWMEQLSANKLDGAKLRLLLLEREASLQTGWLSTIQPQGYGRAAVAGLFDPAETIRLEPLVEAMDRRLVLRTTIKAGAGLQKKAAPAVPEVGKDKMFDQRLAEPQWGDPLTLMMAGLTALDTGLVEAMAIARKDLALRLAQRECDRVERFGQGAPSGLMQHMTAYATLCGGLTRSELVSAAKTESEAIGLIHPKGPGVLADCVLEALRAGNEAKAVQPDVVGEALLLTVWGGEKADDGSGAVLRAKGKHTQRVAASLVRCAQDFCLEESEHPEPLHWLDALIESGKEDVPLLSLVAAEMPDQTLALRERALTVEAQLVAALRGAADASEDSQSLLAGALANLGNRLSDSGRREEALQAAEEANNIHRQLAAARPDAFLPDLAISLNNLGNRLSDVGRREEALPAAEEAVKIRRQLAASRPDAFLPDLAGSLNNLGIRLSNLGRWEDALQAAEEATKISRQLTVSRPDAFLPYFAMSLNNLGRALSDLGRRGEALQAAEEATKIRRQLAASRPDAFLPDLAGSLNNLGNSLSDLGRQEEALHAMEEAVKISRQLAAARPDAFLPDLAMSLNNLASRLSALGRREEALQNAREATDTYRQLAAARPDAFLPDLARSLGARGAILARAGNAIDAAESFREGMQRLKPLFLRSPNAFRSLMARLAAGYSEACEKGGSRPDSALLKEILPKLTEGEAGAAGA
jgi:tetratricopeptide (TPR) repeat protein